MSETRTRFKEDCDFDIAVWKKTDEYWCRKPGLALKRIATLLHLPYSSHLAPPSRKPGLALKRIATERAIEGHTGGARMSETRTRFKEDCDTVAAWKKSDDQWWVGNQDSL